MTPFIVTGLLGKLDVDAVVLENPVQNPLTGYIIRTRAVRHGVSLAIAALYPEHREILRLGRKFLSLFLIYYKNFILAGLLTLDLRKKERSKINQPGARAKWIWKKR